MRNLFILRGAPGSGKSTWIRENNLQPYTIAADNIRRLLSSPILTENGTYTTNQDMDSQVWCMLLNILEQRMQRGDFIIIDATHYKSSLISKYKSLVEEYRYRVNVVDFTNISTEEIIRRNHLRQEWEIVPDDIIEKMVVALKDITEVKKAFPIISPDEAINKINKELDCIDLNQYEKIVIFGDIHGCYQPLKEYFDKNPFNANISYIFTGDYLDRGIQNKEVLEFLLTIYNKPNVALLEGNHEIWLKKYAKESYNPDKYNLTYLDHYEDKQINKLINCLEAQGNERLNKSEKHNKLAKKFEELKEKDGDIIFYEFEELDANKVIKDNYIKAAEYKKQAEFLKRRIAILEHEARCSKYSVDETCEAIDLINSTNNDNLYYKLDIDGNILQKYGLDIKKLLDDPIKSGEFRSKTIPQIADLKKVDLRQLCRKFIQLSYFEFHNQKYLVTHGGLPSMPNIKTPTNQIIKGVGPYAAGKAVMEKFAENYDIIQIHAHRNVFNDPIELNNGKTYNLCDTIEYGGNLRIIEITDKVKCIQIPNQVFIPREEIKEERKTNLDILRELIKDKYINIGECKESNIISLNFSSEAFYHNKWNERTCTARGLFVDKLGKIVGRSYPKFFNWGQNESNKSPALKEKLTFPVHWYKKENGFLGLISKTDKVRFFTKSKDCGEFCDYFKAILYHKYLNSDKYSKDINKLREIYENRSKELYNLQLEEQEKQKLTPEELRERRQFLRNEKDKVMKKYDFIIDNIKSNFDEYTEELRKIFNTFELREGYTYIFEVIDPINDPHIIKYNNQEIILLDIVQNTLVEDIFLPYIEVQQEADKLKIRVKSLEYTFNNWDELYQFRQDKKNDWNILHEGWVITDEKYRVKMKSTFYNFWKEMRKNLHKIQNGTELRKTYKTKEEIQAVKLMQSIPRDELKKMNIIDIEERLKP